MQQSMKPGVRYALVSNDGKSWQRLYGRHVETAGKHWRIVIAPATQAISYRQIDEALKARQANER